MMTSRGAAAVAFAALALAPVHAQRRGTGTTGTAAGGSVSFAVVVTDASGAPIDDAKVTVTGTEGRTGRTEAGRLAFENLRPGPYRFRFDKDGYVPLERELTARGGAPVDVKVALDAAPPPPKPMEPVKPPPPPPAPTIDAKPMGLDLPTYIKNNYVGRAAGRASGLSCTIGGAANLLQINDPIKQHTHADSDEFMYVIAGEGNAQIGTSNAEPMSAGMFVVVPRGTAHSLTATKKPLVVLSILAGDKCASGT
jgi:mannose-6-phosphate isomerase-like protein (cupin superfamily)